MIKPNILPADNYIVLNKTILTDQDSKLLIMLYQPIVGVDAINLFLTLWSCLDKNELMSAKQSHHYLINKMQITMSEILTAREKLEAVGLLKTYFHKDKIDSYVYVLYSPLGADEFLNNPLLGTVYYNAVGREEYEQTIAHYEIPSFNLNEYEDISAHFKDVFESSYDEIKEHTNLKKISKNNIILNNEINIDEIISLIPEELINFNKIDKETKELIKTIIFIYGFNNEEIVALIKNTIDNNKQINKNLLREKAQNYFGFEYNDNPSIMYKTQPSYLKKETTDNSKKSKIIYQFENITPYDFLCSKYDGIKPLKTDIRIVEHLLLDLKLNPGVVNVLIDYVLKINNNKLTKNFIEAIASQWKKSKIETVSMALEFASKEYNKRKNPISNKKETLKPDWLDKQIDIEEATNDEKKEMEDLLKEFR